VCVWARGEGEEEERLRRVNVPPMSLTSFPVSRFSQIYGQQRKGKRERKERNSSTELVLPRRTPTPYQYIGGGRKASLPALLLGIPSSSPSKKNKTQR
jgi:hypothetical protein